MKKSYIVKHSTQLNITLSQKLIVVLLGITICLVGLIALSFFANTTEPFQPVNSSLLIATAATAVAWCLLVIIFTYKLIAPVTTKYSRIEDE